MARGKLGIQIEIPRRSATCFSGGEVLSSGMEYFSVLNLNEEENCYIRQDYCLKCWEIAKDNLLGMTLSSWKSFVPIKKKESDLPRQRDARAIHLLREALLCNDDPEADIEAFVLSIYLARRRRIFFREELLISNKTHSLYEVSETEEMLCVPRFAFSDLAIEKVQEKLAMKLASTQTS